jgi:transposase
VLGPPKARHVDRPVRAALEALVPPGHFCRHLEAVLALSFVRELVRDRYAAGGRPGLDPVTFFKLQLVLFFEGLRSERRLVEVAALHLAHRWYLGYARDEPLPDHATLTKVRQRLGVAVFRRFFEHVVELCQQAGLVRGKELFFDATRVRANAAVDSVVPRLGRGVDDHVETLFPEGGDASDGPAAAGGPSAPLPAPVVPRPPRLAAAPPPAPPPAPPRPGAGRRPPRRERLRPARLSVWPGRCERRRPARGPALGPSRGAPSAAAPPAPAPRGRPRPALPTPTGRA